MISGLVTLGHELKSLIEYEIKVKSDGGEDSMTFDDIMNREVDTAYIKVSLRSTITTMTETSTYEGIYVEMIVGIGSPDCKFDFEDGSFTGKIPPTNKSDYSATVLVKGGTVVYEYSTYLLTKELPTDMVILVRTG